MRVAPIDVDGVRPGRAVWMWCPGCDDLHRVLVRGEDGSIPEPCWDWDGNTAAPTIDPSILCTYGDRPGAKRCHSYVRGGRWEFLADCTHSLAGQTVPMVPIPAGWFS